MRTTNSVPQRVPYISFVTTLVTCDFTMRAGTPFIPLPAAGPQVRDSAAAPHPWRVGLWVQ